jgi:hypothetical protein
MFVDETNNISGFSMGYGVLGTPLVFRDAVNEIARFSGSNGNFSIGSPTLTSKFNVGTSNQFQVNSTGAIVAGTGITQTGNITLSSPGNKINIATGANASVGTGTLAAGTVTVATTAVTANSIIIITPQETGTYNGRLRVSARTAGTGFTVTSSDAADTVVFGYQIIN